MIFQTECPDCGCVQAAVPFLRIRDMDNGTHAISDVRHLCRRCEGLLARERATVVLLNFPTVEEAPRD